VRASVAAVGRLAGIDVDQGEGPEDMDAVLIEAAYQSNFDAPHFLGGPCCFHYAQSVEEADHLAARAAPVIRGFLGYLRKRSASDIVASAEVHVAVIDAAFAWLRKTVRSH
jgi:hypothetical protein